MQNFRGDKQKLDGESETKLGEARESRGRFRLNMLILMNVLLGIAQIVVAAYSLSKDGHCDEPLVVLLIICGIVNFVQVFSFTLWGCSEEVLHPLDEYGDEEFGWPLYLMGLVVWLSFICDFTLWIVMQMLYFGDLGSCDDDLKMMTLVSIIVRWVLIVASFAIAINHLMDKIHQENKRKFGRNPYKTYKPGKRVGGLVGQMFGQTDSINDEAENNEQFGAPEMTIEMGQTDLPKNFASSRSSGAQGGQQYTKAVTVM
jgi:hypothetical protein